MAQDRRRVVVTGLGIVSPVGTGVERAWQALVQGKSGIGAITQFDSAAFTVHFAGECKDFVVEDFLDNREIRRNARFIHFAMAAAEMAVKDSGLDMQKENADRVGVVVGAGLGGLSTLEETHKTY